MTSGRRDILTLYCYGMRLTSLGLAPPPIAIICHDQETLELEPVGLLPPLPWQYLSGKWHEFPGSASDDSFDTCGLI